MALYTAEQLLNPPTTEDVKQSIYDALTAMGVTTTNWKPGAVVRTMIAACAIVLAALGTLISLTFRSGFLALSEGKWKQFVAKYSFGVDFLEATFAIGSLTVTNTSGGIYNFAAGEYTVSNAETGALYVNQDAISIPIGVPSASVTTITIQAVEIGAAGSALAGQISETVTKLDGVTVSNPDALVGRDEETDPELDARAGEKLGSLSPNGPWDAYAYVAKSAKRADGSSLGITRVRVQKQPYGVADIYVATTSGTVTGSINDLNTDLGIVNDEFQRKCVPLGYTATAVAATPREVDGTYTTWIYNTSGAKVEDVDAAIQVALATRLGQVPIGGDQLPGLATGIHTSMIDEVIARVKVKGVPLSVVRTVGSFTGASLNNVLPLTFTEAPTLGTIVGTIIQVPPPGSA